MNEDLQLDLFGEPDDSEFPRPLTAVEALTLASIPYGKDAAVKADEVQAMTGTEVEWRTQAPTRQVIRSIILAGYPICSSSQGFWRPTTRAEVEDCAEHLHSRAIRIFERAAALRRGGAQLAR